MQSLDNNTQAFLALVRAGLWETDVRLSQWGNIDFKEIYQLAEEQSVVGLVAAGLEHVIDCRPVKEDVLSFVGSALQIEHRNNEMNSFIANLIGKMRSVGIYSLLVKGQGVAQCYERPLWRSCGDVDLFLSNDNYQRTKSFLMSMAQTIEEEKEDILHFAVTIDSWVVELHGTLNRGLSKRVDKGLDRIKKDIFEGGNVRSWMNGNTQIFLPSADNDAIIVFTHILQHFFYGGIGLRQVCDWCRLLWTYKDKLNQNELESRIKSMGLKTEWEAFASLAVNNLGMPEDSMPMYKSSRRIFSKANYILAIIIETGNFGHNRDTSYYKKYPFLLYKSISFFKNSWDSLRHMKIFPKDATRIWFIRLFEGIRFVAKGK